MSLRRKPRPIWRPGVTPPMPPRFRELARKIRHRDHNLCRRCGWPAPGGAVDHIIPRRLLAGDEVALEANLALLCGAMCHAYKTMVLEPKLYGGDVLAFDGFLAILARSGPVPSTGLRANAYERLTALVAELPRRSVP